MEDFLVHWFHIPDYSSYTLSIWAMYVLFGTFGFLLRIASQDMLLRLPSRESGGLRLNALGEWLAAVVVATLADQNLLVVTAAGAGAPTILQWFFVWIKALARKGLGAPPDQRTGDKS